MQSTAEDLGQRAVGPRLNRREPADADADGKDYGLTRARACLSGRNDASQSGTS